MRGHGSSSGPAVSNGGTCRADSGFVRGLGLFDSTMIVVGSMIGSGIFIVSADIARQTGSTGGLLVAWIITGVLTVAAALSYGELAAMMPKAGGQYVYLREAYSPLWGFLYGWTLFLVIQTGTIAAVAVAFARFLGVSGAGDFADGLDRPADPRSPTSMRSAFPGSNSSRILLIVFLTAAEYARAEAGASDSEYFHLGEDAGAGRADRRGHLPWAQRRRHSGQFLATSGPCKMRRPSSPARISCSRLIPARHCGFGQLSACSSRSASRRSARFFPPTPGTTSPSRRAK